MRRLGGPTSWLGRPRVLFRPRGAVPPVPSIASLYGIGPGQIPLHLDPAQAVLGGSGNVASVPNSGGAGSAFDALKAGTPTITRSGNLLSVASGAHLALANHADMAGTRVFMVAALAESGATLPRLFGSLTHGTYARIDRATGGWRVQRGAEFRGLTAPVPGTTLRLIEVEMAAGMLRIFYDGVQVGEVAQPFPDFLVNLLFTADQMPFSGTAGDILSLIVDGTGTQVAQVALIRQRLAAKHGLTVAA